MTIREFSRDPLAFLEHAEHVSVRQRVEPLEFMPGVETRNRYEVRDAEGQTRLFAVERGGFGRWFLRQILESLRPFRMEVCDTAGFPVLELRRPFRFYFHRLEVRDAEGRLLGVVRRRFSWIRRIYAIDDAQGSTLAELFGPILRPWTFEIRVRDRVEGYIRKKWSGLAKETFTVADNFHLELGPDIAPRLRVLCLGATFLVDFVHFESGGFGVGNLVDLAPT